MRKSFLPRSTKPIRKKKRTKADYARIYGSPARQKWVASLNCIACGRVPTEDFPSHNHHTETGGTSRKADYDTIIPLCGVHPEVNFNTGRMALVPGCHEKLHHMGRESFELEYDVDLEVAAIAIQEQWASRE